MKQFALFLLFMLSSTFFWAQTPSSKPDSLIILKPQKVLAKPLLIVDGVQMPNKTIKDLGLNAENIAETKSINAENAQKVYGEVGKHGVILVTTKNSIRDIKIRSGNSSSPVRD